MAGTGDKLLTASEIKEVTDTKVNKTDTIAIEHGGTNATSASSARTNLDVYSKSEVDTAIAQSTANEGSATVTYNIGAISTNNNSGFIGTKGNLYICNLQIMINGTVNAGEHDAATVSITPKHNITGVIIRNSDSFACGSFDILTSGKIYMYFTSTITTTSPELYYLTGCGIAKS